MEWIVYGINLWYVLILYIAIIVATFIHEFFHFGKIKINWFFPPASYSEGAKLGGTLPLLIEIIIIWLIFHYNPSIFFIQLVGFAFFVHFTLGSILRPIGLWWRESADIKKGEWIWLILGVIVLIYFWHYYFSIGMDILHKIFVTSSPH